MFKESKGKKIKSELEKARKNAIESVGARTIELQRQTTIDERIIKGMVKPEEIKININMLNIYKKRHNDLIDCPDCKGIKIYNFDINEKNYNDDKLLDVNDEKTLNVICETCDGKGQISIWKDTYTPPAFNTDDDELLCGICYGSSNYGISKECIHFFCNECIVSTLEYLLSSGEFPAYCPVCKAEDVLNDDSIQNGLITEDALSFLLSKNVIQYDLYYRFTKQLLRAETNTITFFKCPNRDCDRYLKMRPVEYSNNMIMLSL